MILLIAGSSAEANLYGHTVAPVGRPFVLVFAEGDLARTDAEGIVCTGRFWLNDAYDSPTMLAMERAGVRVHYSQLELQ